MKENYPKLKLLLRSTVTSSVKKLCDQIRIRRYSIGIITGVRAELYFDGGWSSVSMDSIGELAAKGTDIVFIEKQGVPEMLAEWADKYGIAMVNTRGHLTEYGKDLMDLTNNTGGHVAIMADYDTHGIKIASETPSEILWIGANDEMLEYFDLDRDSVSVASKPGVIDYVTDLVKYGKHPEGRQTGQIDNRFKSVDTNFINGEGIELDAIIAAVGDERFFQYILKKLKESYPKRDYNRAIETQDLLLLEVPDEKLGEPLEHENIVTKINDRIQSFTKDVMDDIKEELKEIDGFIDDVKEKRKKIKERLGKVLTEDSDYMDFVDELNDLVNSHPFFENKKSDSETGDSTS